MILGLIITPLIIFMCQSPILIRIPNFHSIRGHPLVIIFNPFRDKKPEIIAESFLQSLRDGKCLESTSSFTNERATEICNNQLRYPLLEWEIIDLKEENGTYLLIYKHKSKNALGTEDMRIWVKKNEQNWKVVNFIIGY